MADSTKAIAALQESLYRDIERRGEAEGRLKTVLTIFRQGVRQSRGRSSVRSRRAITESSHSPTDSPSCSRTSGVSITEVHPEQEQLLERVRDAAVRDAAALPSAEEAD